MREDKMPKQPSLFNRLTRLFRSGPIIKRRVKDYRQPAASSALEVFKRAHSDVYSNTLSAYGSYDRMSRYSDFSEMETTPEDFAVEIHKLPWFEDKDFE